MKSRPILFSAPMVRAILEGRKTQTRRVVNPQPKLIDGALYWASSRYDNGDGVQYIHTEERQCLRLMEKACPYGVPGVRLWVRESIYLDFDNGWSYNADRKHICIADPDRDVAEAWMSAVPTKRLSYASLFMPRWASRITLEITSVRVERLNDINIDDASAEGCPPDCGGHADNGEWFEHLWDSLNAKKHPWSSNPWVWVVEFKKIEGGAA